MPAVFFALATTTTAQTCTDDDFSSLTKAAVTRLSSSSSHFLSRQALRHRPPDLSGVYGFGRKAVTGHLYEFVTLDGEPPLDVEHTQ